MTCIANNRGLTLPATLLFMLVLGILAAIGVKTTVAGLGVAAHHKTERQSFYRAEAGVTYPTQMIEAQLEAGTLRFWGSTVTVNYPEPATMQKLPGGIPPFSTFAQTNLEKIPGSDRYRFRSTGEAGSSRTTLEVEIERDTFLQYGVFGNLGVNIKNHASVSSVDTSFDNPAPATYPTASTGKGNIGSNGTIDLQNWAVISGSVMKGPYADYDADTWSTVSAVKQLAQNIPDDPLAVEALVDSKAAANDNNLIGGITSITTSITLPPGSYHFTKIALPTQGFITVTGPVKIYLAGQFETCNKCQINYATDAGGAITTKPADLQIYSKSDVDIDIDNQAKFIGALYAPKAAVTAHNNSLFLGFMWAKQANVDNNAKLVFDTALRTAVGFDKIFVKSWKQIP